MASRRGKSAKLRMTDPLRKFRRGMKLMLALFSGLFVLLIVYLVYSISTYGARWFISTNNPRLESIRENVIQGEILDRNGLALAATENGKRVYTGGKSFRLANAHVVGDSAGMTVAGAETFFAHYLLGFRASVFERAYQAIVGIPRTGDSVMLTVDSKLNDYVYGLMGKNAGAIVILNYKTGEVLSLVSAPAFDPASVKDYADDAKKPLVNRATMGRYPPGSIFKLVTASALIKDNPNAVSLVFTCTGELAAGDNDAVHDFDNAVHEALDLKKALAVSCNVTFAGIAKDLGGKKMRRAAESFGFNADFLFDDIVLYNSQYPEPESERELVWSGIGQSKVLITPFNAAMIAAAIANDGVMMEPKMLAAVKNPQGEAVYSLKQREYARPLTKTEADALTDMMVEVVKSGTGTAAAIKGVRVAGKTGTAEVGEGLDDHAWFVGFVDDAEHPLAIAVLLENAGSGGKNAAPVAKKALEKAMSLGY